MRLSTFFTQSHERYLSAQEKYLSRETCNSCREIPVTNSYVIFGQLVAQCYHGGLWNLLKAKNGYIVCTYDTNYYVLKSRSLLKVTLFE